MMRANERGLRGAMYPWESATTGVDVTPDGNIEGDYEIHVTADIPLAMRLVQYWSGGDAAMNRGAVSSDQWEVILQCTRFLADRIQCAEPFHSNDDFEDASESANSPVMCAQYTYYNVQPPDEKAGIVNSSVYTNAAAAQLMLWASQLAQLLDQTMTTRHSSQQEAGVEANRSAVSDVEIAQWVHIAENMLLPVVPIQWINSTGDHDKEVDEDNPHGLIHPEFAGYAGEAINQADVVLMQFPLRYPPILTDKDAAIALSDLTYYASRTSVPGATSGFYTGDSSYSIAYLNLLRRQQSQIASSSQKPTDKVNLKALADEQFELAFQHMDLERFGVWREKILPDSGHLNFVTGAGGYLQNIIYGYGGLTPGADGLLVDHPLLPPGNVTSITFRRLHYGNAIFTLTYGYIKQGDDKAMSTPPRAIVITITMHAECIEIYQYQYQYQILARILVDKVGDEKILLKTLCSGDNNSVVLPTGRYLLVNMPRND